MPPGFGVMMGQEASTLASEYGPQCMNMPNLAFRYQAVRSSEKSEANTALGRSGSEPTTAASRRKSRRRSEEHTSELQSLAYLVCRLLLEKKNKTPPITSEYLA